MYLGDRTWPEVGATDASVALLPFGSTEQHGPHLPLATDHLIAEGLAREAADRAGVPCTPTIDIGVSPHHKQFPGTLWVDAPEFRSFVDSYTRNLAYHGIDRLVYVNAHGGNIEHLREVGRGLRDDGVAFAVEWMWDRSIPDLVDDLFEHNGPHAGPKETAMIMHLAPDLVREDRLADARDGGVVDPQPETRLVHGGLTNYDAADTSPNGAYGDPTDATPETGERLFEAATDQLVALVEWLEEKRFADLAAKPRREP